MTPEIRCVWPAQRLLGEGVLWSALEEAVYWVDIKEPAILRYHPGSDSHEIWPLSEMIGSVALCADGDLVAAMQTGFYKLRLAPTGGAVSAHFLTSPDGLRSTDRFNDGACAPDGSFWAGTVDNAEKEDRGWFYRLRSAGSLDQIAGPFKICNGPCFSPDGKFAYFADSARRIIYRFSTTFTQEPEPFVRIAESDGYPDGMTTDAQGHLWIALWDGWGVLRITQDGEAIEKIPMPVARPTRCSFGGADLKTLYISSARSSQPAPLDGGLFAFTPGVQGLPPNLFA